MHHYPSGGHHDPGFEGEYNSIAKARCHQRDEVERAFRQRQAKTMAIAPAAHGAGGIELRAIKL